MFVYAQNETNIYIIPQLEVDFNFNDYIIYMFSEESFLSIHQITKKNNNVNIDNVSLFDGEYGMKITIL
jgi:hypothetical protein